MATSRGNLFTLACFVVAAATSCNGNGGGPTNNPLNVTAPYLTDVSGSVRNVIVTARADQRQAGEMANCSLEADLFDAPMAQSLTPSAMSGECAVYPTSAMIDLRAQQWVCAGAVIANSSNLALCPAAGANVTPVVPIDCTGLSAGAMVSITSGDELPNDVVTDLNGTVTFPGAITFTQPTALGITSWPASGDVPVAWSSAGATAALVRVEARMAGSASNVIVCRPHTNGTVTLPDALLTQSGLRAVESMIRVFSYGDATTTAEMGHSYHLFAGLEAAVVMQRP